MREVDGSMTNNKALAFLQGGGEMGALMREYDWNNHSLGDPANWPQSLKTNIRLMLHSQFPMFIWWSKGLYKFYNDAYIPALGKKHPDALGGSARDIWSEIWDNVGDITEGILENGQAFYAENLLLYLERKGFAEETYWTFSYSPAFDDKGEVEGVFCACYEETNSVLSQRRLNTLNNASEVLSQIYTIEQACQVTCDLLSENSKDIPYSMIYLLNRGTSEAKLAGTSGDVTLDEVQKVVSLNKLDKVGMCPMKEALTKRQPILFDPPFGSKDTQKEIATTALPRKAVILPILRSEQEEVLGFFVAGINPHLEYSNDYQNFHKLLSRQIATSIISTQAREAVMKQQKALNEMFQQAPVGITILRGPNYIIDLANPGICQIWGRRQEDLIGKPVLEALPEVKDQGIKELLDGVYETEQPFVANELPVDLERNGKLETAYLNFVYQPVRNEQGEMDGIIAVAIDISEQVAARREIEAMNGELLAINADLDNFVYAASHDLKAPISNIEGLMHALTDCMSDDTLASELVQELIGLIHSSIERFKKALSDLTEVAKIQREAGDDVSFINLADVVGEVTLDFESVIKETGAVVETDISEGAAVQFSAKNIRSIVYNLISNALKYRSPDRPPFIRVFTETSPESIMLAVADNGLGINMADEDKIFSMFKRLHDHVEGSGIGLYIVKRIVENAGGRIEVESRLGIGSVFKVYFRH
ncbi:ATP-binding protein [uncultured Pontibacter sp.]|uniref:ATP-binding protein n=1 Tax=uncultured Pontibacter sp. TaxID=453356 RepID=UPI00260A7BA1|nr:ATP-binding protein [uncultured Pontibacter sp.]